jgi:hypothetical protein
LNAIVQWTHTNRFPDCVGKFVQVLEEIRGFSWKMLPKRQIPPDYRDIQMRNRLVARGQDLPPVAVELAREHLNFVVQEIFREQFRYEMLDRQVWLATCRLGVSEAPRLNEDELDKPLIQVSEKQLGIALEQLFGLRPALEQRQVRVVRVSELDALAPKPVEVVFDLADSLSHATAR